VNRVPFLDLRPGIAARRGELAEAFGRVLDSGRFILGDELKRFEAEFAAYCGAAGAVGVGNGLDALALSLQALGVGPGDEVVVPAHTFIATWLAVARVGATPVAAEPDGRGYSPTPRSIEPLIGRRTKAVIAVHLYGSAEGAAELAALCRERKVLLVEDAAQAHGARSGGVAAGCHGAAGCFSFYPSKNLGALGDGGAVVGNDEAVLDRLRVLRNYGSRHKYLHEEAGVNSRLDELQAAFLRVGLRRLDDDIARRREIASTYLRRLQGAAGLELPDPGREGSHVWHVFAVQADDRDSLQHMLDDRGIECLIHYPKAVYRHAPFSAFAPPGESAADRVAARTLSLPMGPHLSDEQVDRVCDAVLRSCAALRAPR
jgi:dTDP-3-amino-3,4,6-trideoxy-alpha-D-glucose transaminase